MKKILVVLLVVLVLSTSCSVIDSKDEFSDDYTEACFDLGGLMGKDGCVPSGNICNGDKTPVAESPAVDNTCEVKLTNMGAPAKTIAAICNGTNGTVSQRLTSGTYVPIGSLTFDNEYRVWFLTDWKVPTRANYSFSYKDAEKNFFDAPFVIGSELGYGLNGERVPFKVCWDVTSQDCQISDDIVID